MQFLRQPSIALPPKTYGLWPHYGPGLNMLWLAFSSLFPSPGSTHRSVYCRFVPLLLFPVISRMEDSYNAVPNNTRHSWDKELRETLTQGQKETEMISPPTSKQPNPANNRWCTWQGTYCQVSLYWRPLPQSTALGSFKSDPEAKTASSATPDFWVSESETAWLFVLWCHWF